MATQFTPIAETLKSGSSSWAPMLLSLITTTTLFVEATITPNLVHMQQQSIEHVRACINRHLGSERLLGGFFDENNINLYWK